MSDNWIIRKYINGDEDGIIRLVNDFADWGLKIYKKSLKAWNWKYKENYLNQITILVAENNNKIIGFYSIVPIKVLLFGNSYLCGRAEEGLVVSSFREKGIFNSLLSEGIKLSNVNNIDFIYGIPSPASLRVHSKLGWQTICYNSLLVKILNVKKINNFTSYKRKRFFIKVFIFFNYYFNKNFSNINIQGIEVAEISQFNKKINKLWESNYSEYDFIIERKMDYLNWRYVNDPIFNNKIFIVKKHSNILGYIVLGINKNTNQKFSFGYILDIFCNKKDSKIINLLVLKAIKYFNERGIDGIKCRMLKDTSYYDVLSKHGFFEWSTKPFILRSTKNEMKILNFDKKKIHITFGDGF